MSFISRIRFQKGLISGVLGSAVFIAFFLPACSDQPSKPDKQVIAQINGYELTLEEYEAGLVRELEYDLNYKATAKARKEFLDQMIRKELLIQEAVNRKMDKEKSFIQTIEKYWEATLIKNLMESQIKAIQEKTVVTDQQIRDRYARLKTQKKNLPDLKEVEYKIARTLKQEKEAALIDQWVDSLKQKADIKINDTLLKRNF